MHDLAEAMEKMEKVKELKEKLMECICTAISVKGLDCIDTKEAGEVIDMIKDLSETEKCCMEALYYQKVTEAMVSYDEPRYDGVYGYNPNRSSQIGRYMGAPSRGDNRGGNSSDMGPEDYMREAKGDMSGRDWQKRAQDEPDSRYGKAYKEYKMTRRHYTSTNSEEDKKEMNVHAQEHVHDSIETIRDIWNDADPALKRRMKDDFTKLVNEMTI